ncbi:hypothetical protein DFJ74DRAFT_40164 [Hyaloraphidium curvatum]|nr:hypothetical protein DFJ74DRAFT_40164 [Hyaloraphidium curvatum]
MMRFAVVAAFGAAAALLAPGVSAQTIPARATAPWPVLQYYDAVLFNRSGAARLAWGDYWERSDEFFYGDYLGQTRELEYTDVGGVAWFAADLGNATETLVLRVAQPGNGSVRIRVGGPTGTVLANCTIPRTGSLAAYAVASCPIPAGPLATGNKTIAIERLEGTVLRLNWVAFWATGTVQSIDTLMSRQRNSQPNKPVPPRRLAGTPARSQTMLPPASANLSAAYGVWEPLAIGECKKWMHDSYSVLADSKVYPTWHPPVDFDPETGAYCTYGHEHGDDPAGSRAFSIGGMPPFGAVNEAHMANNVSLKRREDHVGHKVRIVNNMTLYEANNSTVTRACDILIKLHMGTHSPDALVNTAHEVIAYGQCAGLEAYSVRYFALFGVPGRFKEAEASGCNQGIVPALLPNPPNQPSGGTHRAIPTRDCFLRGTLDEQLANVGRRTQEFWLGSVTGSNLYSVVEDPSRIYDPSQSTLIGRTHDSCYNASHPLAATLGCQLTVASSPVRIPWNDTRSYFRGVRHGNSHISGIGFPASNATTVYTDAYLRNPRLAPDATNGIIYKQLVPRRAFSLRVDGMASVFPFSDYSAAGRNGVRAPN